MQETLLRREEQANDMRYNDVRLNRGIDYSNYFNQQQDYSMYSNNYLPAAPAQNDVYTSSTSDNINLNINDYNMYAVNQQANMFAQAPLYQQTNYYDYQTNAYNNVSAQASTRPTEYYQPQAVNHNIFRPVHQQQMNEAVSYNAGVQSKPKVKNKMAITLIAVYFLIIAVCAALILVNVFAGASSATVNAVSSAAVQESGSVYTLSSEGNLVEMQKTAKVIDYKYDTSTNWFDKLCDKIGNKLG